MCEYDILVQMAADVDFTEGESAFPQLAPAVFIIKHTETAITFAPQCKKLNNTSKLI
jgi:hypothetical protein